MKEIRIAFEDAEHRQLKKAKGILTWKQCLILGIKGRGNLSGGKRRENESIQERKDAVR